MSTLQEWLDQNMHRQYPLADDAPGLDVTGSLVLPTSLITDILLCVPATAVIDSFFIQRVIARSHYIDIYVGYRKPDAQDITVGVFQHIDPTAGMQTAYTLAVSTQPLSADKAFETVSGTIIIGSCIDMLNNPGNWTFTITSTAIISTRITAGLAGIRSLQVNDNILTGNIVIKEGVNTTFALSYDSGTDTTTVTINAVTTALPVLQVPLTDDASILQNLTALYGTPVCSINNIKPDTTGNFSLVALDCTQLEAQSAGINISNSCATPCCDKSLLDDIYATISELNIRSSRLENFYQSISNSINGMQARLTGLTLSQ